MKRALLTLAPMCSMGLTLLAFLPLSGFALIFSPKVEVLIQPRLDYGDLYFTDGSFKKEKDFYLRRFELKISQKVGEVKLFAKLAANRFFENYLKGKKENYPHIVYIKKLYALWNYKPSFKLLVGRDKKPFSRAGLNSSETLLLVDKPQLFLDLKTWPGDYYAAQIEAQGFLKGGTVRYRIATANAYRFEVYNHLNAQNVHVNQALGNNWFFRLELSPKGWVERKINNTTLGKRFITFGLSAGYLGNFKATYHGITTSGYATLRGIDFSFRLPSKVGNIVFSSEYLKGKYHLSKLENKTTEGFYVQGGYLLPFKVFNTFLETAFRFEKITNHPGDKRSYIYTFGFNDYLKGKRLKFSYDWSYIGNVNTFEGKDQIINRFQVQIVF